ncbi:MAG: response regulator transcription factor [Candidatus Pacebacteria bacterium]|jgi:DNA-binding response OmpR family regulator|nr:response regulator transcription factor [Candidatus Paceibacterota bacterium]
MRVLIIEDDPEILVLLTSYLESACFAVDACNDGAQGSFLARTNEYDIVILDYMLPNKDGLRICHEIREAGKTMPLLMITVRSEINDKVELLNKGVDDYVTKPFSFEEIIARINALLRRPKALASPVMNIGTITIDAARQRVTKGNKEIYLTRKEYSLLEYLARHEGHVISRGTIMEHVWNMESDPFSNTIEAHIFNLRKKIKRGKTELIRTVPGRGYMLDGK